MNKPEFINYEEEAKRIDNEYDIEPHVLVKVADYFHYSYELLFLKCQKFYLHNIKYKNYRLKIKYKNDIKKYLKKDILSLDESFTLIINELSIYECRYNLTNSLVKKDKYNLRIHLNKQILKALKDGTSKIIKK